MRKFLFLYFDKIIYKIKESEVDTMTFQEAVSKRIFELCEKFNYTPNGLAEASCVPPSSLQNITSCRNTNPSSFVIFLLCNTLGITIKDFFDSDLFNPKNIIIQ